MRHLPLLALALGLSTTVSLLGQAPGPATDSPFRAAAPQSDRPKAAQPAAPRGRASPHETIHQRLDNNRITIVYGRPYATHPRTGEVRQVWGSLVPFGKVWRTGADEATLFITQQPLDLGGATVPAGAYTLYTLPAEDGSAQLLINRKIGQWGAEPYDQSQELARVPLTREALSEPVEQFTMALERNPDGGGFLRLKWANVQYSVPFTVRK